MTEIKPTTETHVMQTKDGTVKITQPTGHKHKGITVILDSDDVIREQVGGFASFLRDYAVVGLAIGFIIGQQANGVAKQLVDTFINPWIQIIFGQSLSTRAATFHHGTDVVKLPWGALVYATIQFFVILAFIYLLIKLFRFDKLKKKK